MSINTYFRSKPWHYPEGIEGNCYEVPDQVEALRSFIDSSSVLLALEIGFNAGHSADLFLSSNKQLKLISFDLGTHSYVEDAKNYIDNTYPFRHRLILGDSKITLPKFIAENSCLEFDFIFIDGDHSTEGALADLENCSTLANDRTIVVLDDTRRSGDCCSWSLGPNSAWSTFVENKRILEKGFTDFPHPPGVPPEKLATTKGTFRGHSWGHYISQ